MSQLTPRQVHKLEMQIAKSKLKAERYNRTSHVVHFFMSLITFGIWIPVWAIATISNNLEASSHTKKVVQAETVLRQHYMSQSIPGNSTT